MDKMKPNESKAAEFDLRQWATKEKYFVTTDTRDRFQGLFEGRIDGFAKACNLIEAEIKKDMGEPGNSETDSTKANILDFIQQLKQPKAEGSHD